MKKGFLALGAVLALFSAVPTHATLTSGTPGLIKDTTLNITWLQDVNLVKTSCDANNALWQAFGAAYSSISGNSGRSANTICNDEGKLNWYEAEAWIAILNAQSYLGYNDWRQPNTGPINGNSFDYSGSSFGNSSYDGSSDVGYNVSAPGTPYAGGTGSELAHLFFNSLGNSAEITPGGNSSTPLQNMGPFSNIQFAYWSSSEYALNSAKAWAFATISGFQDFVNKENTLYVWPVRREQSIQAIPILGGFGLAALGVLLAGVAGWRIRLLG